MGTKPRHGIAFTTRALAAFKPPAPRASSAGNTWGSVEIADPDCPSLQLRVSYGGTKVWYLMYRHGGRRRRLKLGPFPLFSIAEARDRARDELRAISHGADPVATRHLERQAPSFEDLGKLYVERYARPRKRSVHKDEATLRNHLNPALGKFRANAISRAHVREMLQKIVTPRQVGTTASRKDLRGGPVAANRALEIGRKIMNWAIGEDLVPGLLVNPFAGIAKPGLERMRTRDLSSDELAAFWSLLAREQRSAGDVLRLMLLLGQRRGEILRMRWRDIDWGDHVWVAPPELTKTARPYRVPLTIAALAILQRRRQAPADAVWVFPKAGGGAPASETGVKKAFLRLIGEKGADIDDLRPHDLLHVVVSGLAALGVGADIIRRIRGHSDRLTTSRYDHHSYDAEKRAALERWNARLLELANRDATTNVVVWRPAPGEIRGATGAKMPAEQPSFAGAERRSPETHQAFGQGR